MMRFPVFLNKFVSLLLMLGISVVYAQGTERQEGDVCQGVAARAGGSRWRWHKTDAGWECVQLGRECSVLTPEGTTVIGTWQPIKSETGKIEYKISCVPRSELYETGSLLQHPALQRYTERGYGAAIKPKRMVIDNQPAIDVQEKARIDAWIKANNLNEFGDPQDTVYAGGSPLFDEATGEMTDRYVYILHHHPDQPWNEGMLI
jgi:hypothetical protein